MNNSEQMTKRGKKKKITFIVWTVVVLLVLMTLLIPNKTETATREEDKRELNISYNYTDISLGNTKRYSYHCSVPEGTGRDDLITIAGKIRDIARDKTPYNALSVVFYDHLVFAGKGVRLGYIEFVPNGKWEDAAKVKTGDYSKEQMVDHLKTPNWSMSLTVDEAQILVELSIIESKYLEANDDNFTEKAEYDIGEKYGMTEDQVKKLKIKYVSF